MAQNGYIYMVGYKGFAERCRVQCKHWAPHTLVCMLHRGQCKHCHTLAQDRNPHPLRYIYWWGVEDSLSGVGSVQTLDTLCLGLHVAQGAVQTPSHPGTGPESSP